MSELLHGRITIPIHVIFFLRESPLMLFYSLRDVEVQEIM